MVCGPQQKGRQFYNENLRDKYLKIANTPPVSTTKVVKVKRNGMLCLSTTLPPHGVVFYTIQEVDNKM